MKQVISMKRRFFSLFITLLMVSSLFAGMTVAASATEINESNLQIEDNILVKYTGFETIVVIPDGVTVIAAQAFQDNQSIEIVIIPTSVASIGKAAFLRCRNLETVIIKGCEDGMSRLETIGHLAFSGTAIKNITLPASLTTLGNAVFANVDDDFDADKHDTIFMVDGIIGEPVGVIESVTIIDTEENPSCLTSLGTEVFNNCQYLKYINMPQSIETMGCADFRGCKALEEITIPDKVTEIPRHMFVKCESLKTIELSSQITKIDSWAFAYCVSLTEIRIPENVTELSFAFVGYDSANVIFVNEEYPLIKNGTSYKLFSRFKGKVYVPNEELKNYFVTNGDIEASQIFVIEADSLVISTSELSVD